MKILVTGGAGFIGSNLCACLVSEGHEVLCLDNFSTGTGENIAGLVGTANFHVIEHDVEEPLQLGVDMIYHLACPASPVHYQANPIRTLKTSFLGTFNLLELSKSQGAPILIASTSEVYGDPLVHPQPEEYWGNVNPVGMRSCYDEGKRVSETLASDYRRYYGVDARIVRIFNTYGPGMSPDDGRVVSNFIVQALRGESLTVYGDGSQTRSFCYVDDLVTALTRVLHFETYPGPINLGNPAEFTVSELAMKVLALTGSKAQVIYKPLPSDDPARRRPDITLAKQVLQWEPRISLAVGLKRTIEYFRVVLQHEEAEPSVR